MKTFSTSAYKRVWVTLLLNETALLTRFTKEVDIYICLPEHYPPRAKIINFLNCYLMACGFNAKFNIPFSIIEYSTKIVVQNGDDRPKLCGIYIGTKVKQTANRCV